MERIARFVLAHRRWVFAFWFVIFVAGVATAGQLSKRLSFDFSLPGQEGYETEVKLAQAYGVAAYPSYIPVFTAKDGSAITDHTQEMGAVATAIRAIPGLQVLDYSSTKDEGFLTSDRKSGFDLVYSPTQTSFTDPFAEKFTQAVQQSAAANNLSVTVTGYNQLQSGSDDNQGPSILVETLIGATGALVVLIFVFASFLALVPLMIAAVSILSTFLIVLGLTTFADVSFVVEFLISLVGLGVAIDYSLLVVSRWREERAKGAENHDAVLTAVRTAGHAVLASGVTVAISLIALIVVPVPLLRSMGFGGMLIPLVSTTVVLTLLPALLGAIGPRVDWPRIRHEGAVSRGWSAWARTIVRFRWVAAGVAALILAIAIAPVSAIQFGQASSDSLAANGQAHDTLVALRDNGVGTGILTPMEVLVKGGGQQAVVAAAQKVDGVRMAVALPPGRGGISEVVVVPDHETVDNNSVATVTAVRQQIKDLPGYDGTAGLGATVLDYQRAVYQNFPYVLAVIALVTFILLVRTFRSLLLPLKAVLLNLISVTAVFGLSTWFWQEGHGSEAVFGIQRTGAMTFWLPVLVFAFLFGLSMDYEVFILARMREEYDRTGSTAYAVEHGLGRTGRLVTSAALILFFAFAALASAPGTDIKVFATALGSASWSTRPLSGPCWCRPWCLCSASTTGGCRPGWPGCCGSSPPR